VLEMLNLPREQLFQLLGSEDGSGSMLLQALLGANPDNPLTQAGGFATEMALDPMNLLMMGGAGIAGKGINAVMAAKKAKQMGSLGEELSLAQRLGGAADDAMGTVNMAAGPGGLPLGSEAQLLPEAIQGAGYGRASGGMGPINAGLDPTAAYGQDAANFMQNTRRGLRSGLGELYDPAMLDDYRAGALRHNAGQNALTRDAEWAASGMDPAGSTMWNELGPDAAGAAEMMMGNPRFAGLPLGQPSQMGGDLGQIIKAIEAEMAAAQGQAVNPMYAQLGLMGAGGAAGGVMGSRPY
jgi:hypothetical protein